MSKSVNKVILLGHVGKDPEVRFTPSGAIVATFSLATSWATKDASGNWQEKTEWHNLAAYAKQAELARDYVKKGMRLYVEGRLQTRSWDKDGITQYRTEIIVSQVVFASDRQQNGGPPQAALPQQAAPPPRKTLSEELADTEITDEDVPF